MCSWDYQFDGAECIDASLVGLEMGEDYLIPENEVKIENFKENNSKPSNLQLVYLHNYLCTDNNQINQNINDKNQEKQSENNNSEAVQELQANLISQLEECKDWLYYSLFSSFNSK